MEGAKNAPIPKIRLPSSSFDIPEDKVDQAWDTVSSNFIFNFISLFQLLFAILKKLLLSIMVIISFPHLVFHRNISHYHIRKSYKECSVITLTTGVRRASPGQPARASGLSSRERAAVTWTAGSLSGRKRNEQLY